MGKCRATGVRLRKEEQERERESTSTWVDEQEAKPHLLET
jgi:hypothetical protein